MFRWVWAVITATSLWSQAPCSGEAFSRYDHVLGEWETSAGESIRLRKAVHNCVIVEDGGGRNGLHFYDSQAKRWRSLVVSARGVHESFALDGFADRHRKSPFRDGQAGECTQPEYRQFDFWIGHWEVFTPRGMLAGTNHIYKAAGGCALVENWTAAGLTTGISLNFRDPARKRWRQVWVAPQSILEVEGGWDGAALRFGSDTSRLTFTPNRDGTIRQYWEQRRDETWTVAFDGTYRRARQRSRQELLDELESSSRATSQLFDGLTDEQARFRTAEGRWTLHEILDHLVASEKLFQSSVRNMGTSGSGFDPGSIENIILPIVSNRNTRLTAPEPLQPRSGDKPVGELLREFQRLRAETMQIAGGDGLRGNRRPHPLGGTNMDGYQWLLTAATHNRRHLEQAIEVTLDPRFDPSKRVRAWSGLWTGEGKFQGAAARFAVSWRPVLGGKFDELRIDIRMDGGRRFQGEAQYGADLTAHWTDSMGNAYPVRGAWENGKLIADWGRGRSTYGLTADGRFEVVDEVKRPDGTYAVFASYALSRAPLLPASVWDVRRVNGKVFESESAELDVLTPKSEALKRDQDVVYFVELGRAVLVAGHQRIPVQPGSIMRVRAGVEHRFEEMETPPRVLAFVARQ